MGVVFKRGREKIRAVPQRHLTGTIVAHVDRRLQVCRFTLPVANINIYIYMYVLICIIHTMYVHTHTHTHTYLYVRMYSV